MNRQENDTASFFKLRKYEDQRKLGEEIGDRNTLCKLWAQGQSPVKSVPWASVGQARNRDAILGKVQLAASLWLWSPADCIKGPTQLTQEAGQGCSAQ